MSLLLSGCVSIDSRSWKETIDIKATSNLANRYSIRASYWSKGEFVAEDNLADLLGVVASESESVLVKFVAEKGLVFEFDVNKYTKTYYLGKRLKIDNSGKYKVSIESGCGSSEGAIACGGGSLSFFVNTHGDLVVIKSGGGGGLYGLFPIGIYAKHVSIFPMKENDSN